MQLKSGVTGPYGMLPYRMLRYGYHGENNRYKLRVASEKDGTRGGLPSALYGYLALCPGDDSLGDTQCFGELIFSYGLEGSRIARLHGIVR